MASADDAVPIAQLVDERRYLLDVAYVMLGSRREAERVVDAAYRRWFGLPDPARARISEPRAWLAGVTGSICLSRLTLPGRDPGPGEKGTRGSVRQGGPVEEANRVLLDALDSLSPAERAAFLLADVARPAEPQCAESAERARRGPRARPTPTGQHDEAARAVRRACAEQDKGFLVSLLSADATAWFDAGGKVRAPAGPVHGDVRVARSLLVLLAPHPRTTVDTRAVNGRTGLVVRYGRQVAAVISLDLAGPHVVQVFVTLNPDKLRTWNRPRPPGSG
ncbi:RNA polymerase subunit sigma [Streptomyces sp. NPDC057623]|uniref:RNA polymerase subunit sigma n=1 Tax=Streptomyces sp. NPDC057623 TaxID=3346187 RepID=UPI0036A83895